MTPERIARLEKLKAFLKGSSGPVSAGETAARLGCSLSVLQDDLKLLRKAGEMPAIQFLTPKQGQFLRERERRKPQLLRLYSENKTYTEIQDQLGFHPGADLVYWKASNDPDFRRAHATRERKRGPSAQEAQFTLSEKNSREIARFERETGHSIEETNLFNAVNFFQAELMTIASGVDLKLGLGDDRYLRRNDIIKVVQDGLGIYHYSLTDRCKSALFDLGLKSPRPISWKAAARPPDAQNPSE